MLKLLRSLTSGNKHKVLPAEAPVTAVPALVRAPGVADFDLSSRWIEGAGLPMLDWDAVGSWVSSIGEPEAQAKAWADCEMAWLAHVRQALGESYQIQAQGETLLLSSLSDKLARTTLEFVEKSRMRVMRMLEALGQESEWGHDILIVLDDDETYYRYVASYYADSGVYATSSGMYLDRGCGHFVTMKADLLAIEPVIVHEITHACLAHLPLPIWLNEGLAVSIEHRLSPPHAPVHTPQEMYRRHQSFWDGDRIQGFWSGLAFSQPGEGQELSYDLARILVSQLGSDWPIFQSFALVASASDGGDAAARTYFGAGVGDLVGALLEAGPSVQWAPNRALWPSTTPNPS